MQTKILLNFAMVTADTTCGEAQGFLTGDMWNMYYWLHMFKKGYHYSFDYFKDETKIAELNNYDIVMFSGNDGHLNDIIKIAERIRAVTIFFPEGDISLYHDKAIHPETYRAWDACSVVSCVEEDKIPFYEALTHSVVKFLHVPVPETFCNGGFHSGEFNKTNDILIYGDNNPNNPIVALAIARQLNLPVAITALPAETIEFIKGYFGIRVSRHMGKLSQVEYLQQWVAPSKVIIYPTRWIGTARQVISGALCGTPVIGNRDSHTQKRLFPMLGTYIYDIEKMCELTERLYTDARFYKDCCDFAFEQVKFYSEKSAIRRMIDLYNTAKGDK